MRFIIFGILILGAGVESFCQNNTRNKEKQNVALHLGVGYQQDVVNLIGNGRNNELYQQWNYAPSYKGIGYAHLDVGALYQWKNYEIGVALRLAVDRTLMSDESIIRIVKSPVIWGAWHFGKYDDRGFRLGLNLTPATYKMFYEVEPDPTDRVPPVGSSIIYWAFGPSFGTRIIRKGWLKNTYLNLNPQVAPLSPKDKYLYSNIGWYYRINFGLTKNINFK